MYTYDYDLRMMKKTLLSIRIIYSEDDDFVNKAAIYFDFKLFYKEEEGLRYHFKSHHIDLLNSLNITIITTIYKIINTQTNNKSFQLYPVSTMSV